MGSHREELAQILYLCGEDCLTALVFKSQFAHLKACIDMVLPVISDESAVLDDSDAAVAVAQRAQDSLESVHDILGGCANNRAAVDHLATFADISATISQTYFSLLQVVLAYSINVRIDSMGNRWSIFKKQLADWKDAIDMVDEYSENLRRDPRYSKADAVRLLEIRRKLVHQFPEPDVFHRIQTEDLYHFHALNETKPKEDDESNLCIPSGKTTFTILGTGLAGIPVACKTISAVNLKNGAKSLKEIADLYLLTDSTASPYISTMLKVNFSGQEAVEMIFSLPPLGNLKDMIDSFQKTRKRPTAPPGGHEAWLVERGRVEGKLSVMSDAVCGLLFLHSKGIVHGRLKPSNILIFDGYRARITDYGISSFLKVTSRTEAWLQAGRAALKATPPRPPIDSESVPYNDLPIGEGGIRWLAPELLLIPPLLCVGSTSVLTTTGDLTCPRHTADTYAAAMMIYFLIFEKVPFYNIVWNQGVYNILVNGDRPSMDMPVLDCQDEEIFAVLYESISLAWVTDPDKRLNLRAVADNIAHVHQEVSFSIESRILDQLTEKLQTIQAKPEEMKLVVAKNKEKILKGEDAIKKKNEELENALNGKQRKEFTAQLEKGRARLDSFIVETKSMTVALAEMEAEVKATKKSIKTQTEKRYGGVEHILRHRSAHKETTAMDLLIKKYKGETPKSEINDALSSAAAAGASVSTGAKHALQSFLFHCGDRSKSFTDEMTEYHLNGDTEADIIDERLAELCQFAQQIFQEVSVVENEIPRFLKLVGAFGTAGIGSALEMRRGAGSVPHFARDKSEMDLRSENSDVSDVSKTLGVALSMSPSRGKRRDGTSSPTYTDNSEDDLFKFESGSVNLDHRASSSAGDMIEAQFGGLKAVVLEGLPLQYLAAYRGRSDEAIGLIKTGRGLDPETVSQLVEAGETPAHVAASLGHLEVLRNLLENQPREHTQESPSTAVAISTSQSLLHAACISGNEATVRYLVETYNHFDPIAPGNRRD